MKQVYSIYLFIKGLLTKETIDCEINERIQNGKIVSFETASRGRTSCLRRAVTETTNLASIHGMILTVILQIYELFPYSFFKIKQFS
jgi:hypothetical protein